MKKSALLLLIPAFFLAACQSGPTSKPIINRVPPEKVSENTKIGEMMEDKIVDKTMIKSDQQFLEMMIPHHQEAVESSKMLLAQTEDPEMKKFLQGVIDAQSKEIEQMKTWYKDWFGKDYLSNGDYMAMMTDATTGQSYRTAMIVHHMEAIEMAKQLKTFTKRPELIKLAEDIIATQSKEVDFLRGENNQV